MTTVILAEKPDQARAYMDGLGIKHSPKQHIATGSTFLDSNTTVCSAAGHLFELYEPSHYGEEYKDRYDLSVLPIFPEKYDYMLKKSVSSLFKEIKSAVDNADTIIVGTDNDNEGAAIAFNVLRFSRALKYKKIMRVYPSALNAKAVQRAFKNLSPILPTWRAADAAMARGKSDWLIGMNLSRLYTSKLKTIGIRGNFAIGRAISTTLNLICQWNSEIENFKEKPIYELVGKTKIKGAVVPLKSSIREVGEENRAKYVAEVKQAGITQHKYLGTVKLVDSVEKATYPTNLFTKGDLYKEMNRVAGWTQEKSKKVMQLNYEQGYQTYPRTDSSKITRYMYQYLSELFDDYLQAIRYPNKLEKFSMPEDKLKKYLIEESDAGAHLAIIPTEKLMDDKANVTEDQRLMWKVVVRKSLTLIVRPYTYVSNKLGIVIGKLPLTAQNAGMLDMGWRALALPSKKKKKKKDSAAEKETSSLNFKELISVGDQVPVIIGTRTGKTTPPSPLKSIQIYDKGGLMENAYKYVENKKYADILKKANGIGTSATRDEAMASLVAKKYVVIDKKDIITVTPDGWLINWLLSDSKINDPVLTAMWEEEYKKIEDGTEKASVLVTRTQELISEEFNRVFKTWDTQNVIKYYESKNTSMNEIMSLGACPKCGSDVVFVPDTYNKGQFDAFKCTNKECNFRIFKTFFNKSITENDVKQLLKGNKTRLIKDVTTQTGKHFDTKLMLKYDDVKDVFKLRFTK